MDLKVMPRLQMGHKFILWIIHEMVNYLITVSIYHSRSEEVGEALIEHVISKYCASDYIIMDQDSAFMSTLMNYSLRKLNMKIKTVAHTIINLYKWNMVSNHCLEFLQNIWEDKGRCGINICL